MLASWRDRRRIESHRSWSRFVTGWTLAARRAVALGIIRVSAKSMHSPNSRVASRHCHIRSFYDVLRSLLNRTGALQRRLWQVVNSSRVRRLLLSFIIQCLAIAAAQSIETKTKKCTNCFLWIASVMQFSMKSENQYINFVLSFTGVSITKTIKWQVGVRAFPGSNLLVS